MSCKFMTAKIFERLFDFFGQFFYSYRLSVIGYRLSVVSCAQSINNKKLLKLCFRYNFLCFDLCT
jgi:hypothetical protein